MRRLTISIFLLVPTPAVAQETLASFSSIEIQSQRDLLVGKGPDQPIPGDDPVATASTPGPLPELGAPMLYSLAASLSVSNESTKATVVLAPFQLLGVKTRILRDTRVEITTGIDKQLRWGAYVTLPWSTLSEPATLDAATTTSIVAGCYAYTVSERSQIQYLVDTINRMLGARAVVHTPGDSLNVYGGKVAAAAMQPGAPANQQALAKELIDLQKDLRNQKAGCFENKLRAARTKRAVEEYENEFVVGLRLGAELFPLIDEPRISDGMGGTTDPTPESIASISANATASWFPNRLTGIWFTVGLADKRGDIKDKDADKRFGLGMRVAHNSPFAGSNVGTDGFQAGFAVGIDASVSLCLEEVDTNPCGESALSYSDPVAIDKLVIAAPYLDLRASSKIQVRLSLPLQVYALSAAPAGSDGTERIIQLVPSVSLTVSGWPI
jgi:hypothetical protein